jgi:hypothetical protein
MNAIIITVDTLRNIDNVESTTMIWMAYYIHYQDYLFII